MKGAGKYCTDCAAPAYTHIGTWLDDLMERVFPDISHWRLADTIGTIAIRGIEKIFLWTRIAHYEENIVFAELPARLGYFVRALKDEGYGVAVFKGPYGYTYNLRATKGDRTHYIEGFPRHAPGESAAFVIDDKEETKEILKKKGFPVPEGRSFWFWQKNAACRYARSIGYPVVVKPRGGSVARHVTTNIKSDDEVLSGIQKAVAYAPTFLVERYFPDGFVHRATVVDFEKVFCARQLPAFVVGDGASTIDDLVEKENQNRKAVHDALLHEIVYDDAAKKYLAACQRGPASIPAEGERVYLHKDPFVRLGGVIEEVTQTVHPQNSALFRDIAKCANARVVGMDVILEDVQLPFTSQRCAVLELNSLPCIEMHQCPGMGEPQDVAGEIARLMKRYDA